MSPPPSPRTKSSDSVTAAGANTEELVRYLVSSLVENPEAVEIERIDADQSVRFEVTSGPRRRRQGHRQGRSHHQGDPHARSRRRDCRRPPRRRRRPRLEVPRGPGALRVRRAPRAQPRPQRRAVVRPVGRRRRLLRSSDWKSGSCRRPRAAAVRASVSVRPGPKGPLAHARGIRVHRRRSCRHRPASCSCAPSELPPSWEPEPTADVLGSRVTDERHGDLGEIVEVIETGANDVWVVEGPLGQVLLPVIDDVVLERRPRGRDRTRAPAARAASRRGASPHESRRAHDLPRHVRGTALGLDDRARA